MASKEWRKAWRAANQGYIKKARKEYYLRTKEAHRLRDIKVKYSLSEVALADMLSVSKGTCQICSAVFDSVTKFHIDHSHTTGRVRGLLCRECNWVLGVFKDSPDRFSSAAAYLRRAKF